MKMAAKSPHMLGKSRPLSARLKMPLTSVRLIDVSLKRSSGADVQGNRMRAATHYFGVSPAFAAKTNLLFPLASTAWRELSRGIILT